jgi:two-component system sensor histidine kinase AgrC
MDFFRSNIDFLDKKIICIIDIFLIICCTIQYTSYWIESNLFPNNPIRGYMIILFICIIVSLLGYLRFKTKELNDQQMQQLKDNQMNDLEKYVQHIEQMYDSIRGFRHDYKNMLISLNESLETNNLDTIKNTYYGILKNENISLQDSKYDLARLNNLQILPLKSIFSAKIIQALQENIEVSLEVMEPITEYYIEITDYVRILAILLDNAIESAKETLQPKIAIAVLSEKCEEQLVIIENTFSEETIDLEKIFEKGYSTKERNSGLGLANIKEILKQYENVSLETEISGFLFRQKIIMKRGIES